MIDISNGATAFFLQCIKVYDVILQRCIRNRKSEFEISVLNAKMKYKYLTVAALNKTNEDNYYT